jgi:branched-chain amino acid transport system ATP-binding protein
MRKRSARMFLETQQLTKFFGGLAAVFQLEMTVEEGEIVGIIGPNGAGKTTVFNLISGFLKPSSGRVLFKGKDISGKRPHLIARMGIGRTFQLAYLFPEFTVFDNVVSSFNLHPKSGFWEALFKTPSYRRKERVILEEADEILHLVGLEKDKDVLGKNLPHGYQKLLTMARALAIKPKILLLDEPIGGMSLEEVKCAMSVIENIRTQGITILLVEHNMRIMSLCDRVIVINFGNKIAEGSMEEVRQNKEVMKAYFGREDAA